MAANLATAAALLLIMLAAPSLEASGREQATGTGTRTRERAPVSVRVRCTKVHAVQAGETCASVARAAGFSDAGFRVFNPNITCSALFPGQWVCVDGTGVA